jgi:hypothetical protein
MCRRQQKRLSELKDRFYIRIQDQPRTYYRTVLTIKGLPQGKTTSSNGPESTPHEDDDHYIRLLEVQINLLSCFLHTELYRNQWELVTHQMIETTRRLMYEASILKDEHSLIRTKLQAVTKFQTRKATRNQSEQIILPRVPPMLGRTVDSLQRYMCSRFNSVSKCNLFQPTCHTNATVVLPTKEPYRSQYHMGGTPTRYPNDTSHP